MKVFWSWQSDTPGKTGRHFVRDCLQDAIQSLKDSTTKVDEPNGEDRGVGIHLDSDRQGVPGSPDLAMTILEKIDKARVFVADVTPIAQGPARKDAKGKRLGRKAVMNPNVAIELGYALGKHSADGINNLLMVLNTHYGNRGSLPFDLAHKAGPIMYNLSPNATQGQIKAERKRLSQEFCIALRPFLATPEVKPTFDGNKSGDNLAVFFRAGESLADFQSFTGTDSYSSNSSPAFYLRVIPHTHENKFPNSQIDAAASALGYFSLTNGNITKRNLYGSAVIEPYSQNNLHSISQVFQNGEIWGVNTQVLEQAASFETVPIQTIEVIYRKKFPLYIAALKEKLNLLPPYKIEMGLVGVKGWSMTWGGRTGRQLGPIRNDPQPFQTILRQDDLESLKECLREAFKHLFFEMGREHRPGELDNF